MAAYATRVQLSQLGVNTTPLDFIDDDAEEQALEAAARLIDSYLKGAGISVPLSSPGDEIVRANCIIAAYDLMSVRGYQAVEQQQDNLRLRYLDVLKWLEAIKDGDIGIGDGDDDDGGDGEVVAGVTMITSPSRGWSTRGTGSVGGFGGG